MDVDVSVDITVSAIVLGADAFIGAFTVAFSLIQASSWEK